MWNPAPVDLGNHLNIRAIQIQCSGSTMIDMKMAMETFQHICRSVHKRKGKRAVTIGFEKREKRRGLVSVWNSG